MVAAENINAYISVLTAVKVAEGQGDKLKRVDRDINIVSYCKVKNEPAN